MTYAVIMAGGSGTRFWPKSTSKHPKQFLNLFGDKTMIRQTVDRISPIIPEENVLVVTNKNYTELVRSQLPAIPENHIIGEPVARNTAPCIAAAAAILHKKDPESVMVVLPADHRIADEEHFQNVLHGAVELAEKEESLVTVGIEPDRPETGYGYIQFNRADKVQAGDHDAFAVKNFTEKPDAKKAGEFLKSGDYVWNSGMFIWKTSTILKAFELYMPELFKLTEKLIASDASPRDIDQFYNACPSVSIDYGIMESAEQVHVIPAEFGWNDVGSWRAVHELSDKDEQGNSLYPIDSVVLNSSNNLVQTIGDKQVVMIGVENIALVETEDSIMVLNLRNDQDVKQVVEQFKKDPDKKRLI